MSDVGLSDLVVDPELKNFGGYFAKQCREFVRKDHSPAYPEAWKLPVPPALQARFDAGKVFEAGLLEEFRDGFAEDPGVVILDGVEDRSDGAAMGAWVEASMAAFRDPAVWFIANPRLAPVPEYNLTGEPDFAVRLEDGAWYPMDAKDHSELTGSAKATPYMVSPLLDPRLEAAEEVPMTGRPRKENALQLAHYHFMLQAHGLGPEDPEAPARGAILGRSRSWVWYDLDAELWKYNGASVSSLDLYLSERNDRVTVVQLERRRTNGEDVDPGVAPVKKGACAECEWRVVCDDEMRSMDDVSLLPGVAETISDALREGGVHTRRDLSLLDHRTARLRAAGIDVLALKTAALNEPIPEFPATDLYKGSARSKKRVATLDREGVWTVQDVLDLSSATAALKGRAVTPLPRIIDQARVSTVGRVHRARGVEALSLPRAEVEIDIDFEDSGGYTYMFGALVTRRGDEASSKYHAFCSWDQSEEGEAQAFADFWSFLMKRRHAYSSVCYYHYTQHEVSAMKALAHRHAGFPGCPTVKEVVALTSSDVWVDMYHVANKELFWPTSSYTVKDLAKFCGHSWSGEGANGAMSLVWYDTAVSSEDEAAREQCRHDLLVYNQEDNEATLRVRNWLTAGGYDWSDVSAPIGGHLPSVEVLDGRFDRMAQYR